MSNQSLIKRLNKLIEPIIIDSGYELYHIELVSEQRNKYLRIYIDKDDSISLNDCEKVSNIVSDILDKEDPIPYSYYLEVSSPGINRTLYNDKHLSKYVGCKILIKLFAPLNGIKKYEGNLIDFNTEHIIIKNEENNIKVSRDKISCIKLVGDI